MDKKNVMVEYICTSCGQIMGRSKRYGRPSPGTCKQKRNKGPHTWRINRVIG